MIQKIHNKLCNEFNLQKNKISEYILEEQLFLILLIFVVLLSVFNVILNISIDFRFDANYKWVVMFVVALFGIHYTRKNHDTRGLKTIIFSIVIFYMLPNGWILTGGNSHSTIAYVFLIASISSLLLGGKLRIFFMLSQIIMVMMLLINDYINISNINPNGTEVLIYKDALLQVPLTLGAFYFILILFSNAYQREQEKLQNYSCLLEENNQKLRALSITDELTQTYNRRYLYEIFNNLEIYQKDKEEENIRILLIDVDNFKKINDQFGHLYGDEVLKIVSQIMKSKVGKLGKVGRYGGDEFLVIFIDLSLDACREVIEEIYYELESFKNLGNYPIRISGGISLVKKYNSVDGAILAADQLLYKAKNEEKNLIISDEIGEIN